MAWVGYAEEDRDQRVTPVAKYGYEKDYLETVQGHLERCREGKGPDGHLHPHGASQHHPFCWQSSGVLPWKAEALKRGYASVIGLPLFLDGQRLGALSIYSPETDAFDTEEVEFLVKLSGNLLTA